MGMKTTYYEPGNATRYEIGSQRFEEDGETCFVWWVLPGGEAGVAVNMVDGDYCTPIRVWSALPQGVVNTGLIGEPERWLEDCRVIAHYINSVSLPDFRKHPAFKAPHLPEHAKREAGASFFAPPRSLSLEDKGGAS